jgi:hypothetical protein
MKVVMYISGTWSDTFLECLPNQPPVAYHKMNTSSCQSTRCKNANIDPDLAVQALVQQRDSHGDVYSGVVMENRNHEDNVPSRAQWLSPTHIQGLQTVAKGY